MAIKAPIDINIEKEEESLNLEEKCIPSEPPSTNLEENEPTSATSLGQDSGQEDSRTNRKILKDIKESKTWKILVYGINKPGYDQDYHVKLLSGVVGHQLEINEGTERANFQKNEVNVEIVIGPDADRNTPHNDVDLLLVFLPMKLDAIDESYTALLKQINKNSGAEIWKHSVVALTGVNDIVDRYIQQGRAEVCLSHTVRINMQTNQEHIAPTDW